MTVLDLAELVDAPAVLRDPREKQESSRQWLWGVF